MHAARVAVADGGVLWRELDEATQRHGLATTGGTVSNTGVAGLTLGGGLGWLMGKHGLAIDNLLARGRRDRRRSDAPSQSRGRRRPVLGTPRWRRKLRCRHLSRVSAARVCRKSSAAWCSIRSIRRATCCVSIATSAVRCPTRRRRTRRLLTAPQGMPVAALILGYNGPLAEGERVLAPARRFGKPLADLVGPMPYAARQRLLDEPNATHGLHRYWRSAFTEQITDALIDRLVEGAVALQLTAERPALFRPARRRGARRADGDGVRAATAALGLRCIGQWTDSAQSAAHIGWVRAVGRARAAPRRNRLREPSRQSTTDRRRCERRSARTTPDYER